MRTLRMPMRTVAAAATTLLALSFLAACGDTGSDTSAPPASSTGSEADPEGETAPHNDADVEFAQEMIPHHAQAVAMAQMAKNRARAGEVRRLAADIEAAQGPEIELMAGWLESWGEDVPASTGTDHGAMGHDMGDMGDMGGGAGMMSADDMMSLKRSSGRGFDRMFLTMMIEHHEGAIEMARTEQRNGEFPDAVALARTIEDAQTAEISTMRELLGS